MVRVEFRHGESREFPKATRLAVSMGWVHLEDDAHTIAVIRAEDVAVVEVLNDD